MDGPIDKFGFTDCKSWCLSKFYRWFWGFQHQRSSTRHQNPRNRKNNFARGVEQQIFVSGATVPPNSFFFFLLFWGRYRQKKIKTSILVTCCLAETLKNETLSRYNFYFSSRSEKISSGGQKEKTSQFIKETLLKQLI